MRCSSLFRGQSAWSRHISSGGTVLQMYDRLVRKGVLQPDPAQRRMAEACAPLTQLLDRQPEAGSGALSPWQLGAAASPRGERAGPSADESFSATLSRQLQRWLPHTAPRSLDVLRSENVGVVEKRGLYLWGDVGVGKTLILDLFVMYECPLRKRRAHLHSFMAEIAERLVAAEAQLTARRGAAQSPHERRALGGVRPMDVIVEDILRETPVLCFDEFQTFDVAHAALLSAFFTTAFRRGLFVLTTSNRHPDDLCLISSSFKQFLPVLYAHCDVVHCVDIRDYRLRPVEERVHRNVFLFPCTKSSTEKLVARVERGLGGGAAHWVKDEPLWHHGRSVVVPYHCRGVALFDFSDICGYRQDLASTDFQLLARTYHTIVLTNVPQIGTMNRNAAHLFVVLVDELYQHSVKLLFTCQVPWGAIMNTKDYWTGREQLGDSDAYYSEGEDDRSGYAAHYEFRNEEEVVSFRRIRSRLQEMGSVPYLLRDHSHFLVSDFDFSCFVED